MHHAQDKRTGVDRRCGTTPSTYFGVERRTGSEDRRSHFGTASALIERGDVLINDKVARFGDRSFCLAEVTGAEISTSTGQVSLSWFLYGLLASITAMQAGLDNHAGLWAIAAALALLSVTKWWQRCMATVYKLTLDAAGVPTAVLETVDRAEVHLIRDAIHMVSARSRLPHRT